MQKRQEFLDWNEQTDSYENRECTIIDRNGSLVYVETDDGERKYIDYRDLRK